MRVIRLKLNKGVTEALKLMAKTYKIEPDALEDIYALQHLKGNGIPTPDRIDKLSEAYHKKTNQPLVVWKLIISKRVMHLKELLKQKSFLGVLSAKNAEPLKMLEYFIVSNMIMAKKLRQAQCLSCSLLKKCAFGSQYSACFSDITKVIDPDYAKKVHADCPVLPEIGGVNKMVETSKIVTEMFETQTKVRSSEVPPELLSAVEEFKKNKEEGIEFAEDKGALPSISESEDASGAPADAIEFDEDDDYVPPSGKGYSISDTYDGRHDGVSVNHANRLFIEKLAMSRLILFELGKTMEVILNEDKNISFKPSKAVERVKKHQQMKSLSDMPKVEPTANALPEAVFQQKLETNELVIRENQKQEDKKQLLYLLIDSSWSMQAALSGVGNMFGGAGLYTRGAICTALASALVHKAKKDKAIIHVTFFAGQPGHSLRAEEPDEYDIMYSNIFNNRYSGSGTDVMQALRFAKNRVMKEKAELSKVEVLCITDCESHFDPKGMEELVKSWKFNVLDIATDSPKSEELAKCATNYYKVDANALDFKTMIKTVV